LFHISSTNFEYRTEEEKGVWLFQQFGTCARGRIYWPTSEHIILSHKLEKPNIWGKEEVVSLPVELRFLGPSYSTWTWHSSAQRDIHAFLYVIWNIYLLPARTVQYVLVIRFLLCVPLFLGFAYHSYLFRNFFWFPLLLFCFSYTFIVLPTFLLFFYLSSLNILFSSIIIYWPITSTF
jgi:hypothetical protein